MTFIVKLKLGLDINVKLELALTFNVNWNWPLTLTLNWNWALMLNIKLGPINLQFNFQGPRESRLGLDATVELGLVNCSLT